MLISEQIELGSNPQLQDLTGQHNHCFIHFFQMRRSYRLLALLALMATVASVVAEQAAENCNPTVCRLPDCFCGGSEIPGGLRKEETPQFVLLTFDDAVNDLNEKFFSELFKDRTNPNGCPIKVP